MPDDDLLLPQNNDFIPTDDGEGFTPEDLENDQIPDRPVVLSSEPDIPHKLDDNGCVKVGRFVINRIYSHDGSEDRALIVDFETNEEAKFPLSDLKGVRDEVGIERVFEGGQ